ncbi:MAG TPA: ATP-binding protein [Vicinamibacterales bacterium]|nr:ATP-binding protein [Vicinamibacterales bacterium]
MRFRDLPIARKALALGVIPTVCALAVVTATLGIAIYRSLQTNLNQNAQTLVTVTADNMQAPLGFNDPKTAGQLLAALHSVEIVDAACVFDANGHLFAHYATPDHPCPTFDDEGQRSPGIHAAAVSVGTRRVGSVRLFVNDTALRRSLATLAVTAGLTVVVVVLLATVLATRLQHTISNPIVALARTADRVTSTGDYSARAEQMTNDEVGRLVVAFNGMLAQIQQQNRVKDEFLATVSHELRTPLNAMLGWLQIIQRTNPEASALTRALTSLERNAKVQQRVVEDLLDISRVVSGKLQMNLTVVDLRLVIGAAIDVIATIAAQAGVTVQWHPPGSPCLVSGDAARLQQAFWNVLSNGVKFTPRGGTVTASIQSRADVFAIVIRDTGVGIDPAFLPHVFERFQQADSSATREHGGLGLGLAIVHEIVTLHGGSVTATSAGKGRGATFTITLPRLVDEGAA